MAVDLQPAYVLHTRNYRDSSMIVDFLTPEFGRISAVARGVRASSRSAKLRRSQLQAFTPLLIGWSGRSELKTLQSFESRAPVISLPGDKLFSGLYINELLVRLLVAGGEDNLPLFALYEYTIGAIAPAQQVDVLLRNFEFNLLEQLGYGLNFSQELSSGEPLQPDREYIFYPQRGFEYSVGHPPRGMAHSIYSGEQILAIAEGRYSDELRPVAKRLCRQALALYLGDKPLNSRQLFKAMTPP